MSLAVGESLFLFLEQVDIVYPSDVTSHLLSLSRKQPLSHVRFYPDRLSS
jgi:hypothetical protein